MRRNKGKYKTGGKESRQAAGRQSSRGARGGHAGRRRSPAPRREALPGVRPEAGLVRSPREKPLVLPWKPVENLVCFTESVRSFSFFSVISRDLYGNSPLYFLLVSL